MAEAMYPRVMSMSPGATETTARGGIRIADLIAMPSLGLELVAGEEGLHRRVSWTHSSELEDPGAWLDGGELVFTLGLGVPKNAADQVRYIENLNKHAIAGLIIGVRRPPLRQQMIERANELGFPVLLLAREVPVMAISRLVAASSQDIAQRRLAAHVRIFETLRDHPTGARTDAELFRLLGEIAGYRFYLMSKLGRPLLEGLPAPPDEIVDHLLAMAGDETVAPDGRLVPVSVGSRTAGYLVAIEREDRESLGLSAIRHVATVAALRVAELYRIRELHRREGSEHLMNLMSGRLGAVEAGRALNAAGFVSDGPLILAACAQIDPDADVELLHRLLDADVHHLMLRQGELYVLLPDTPEAAAVLESDVGLAIGTSRGLDGRLVDIPLARREALWSLQQALSPGEPKLVRFQRGDEHAHWLPADFASLERLVDTVLGPIIEYDEGHNTELLVTLASSFRHQRKLLVTSKELFIHKHTLAYRLNRIKDLTGRDLNDVGDQAQLWLALKALAVVQPERLQHDPRLRV